MTASLQPLDVYAFSVLKGYINNSYECWILREESIGGAEQFVVEVLRCTERFLYSQPWGRAFRGCGSGGHQAWLTIHLLARYPGILQDGGPGAIC